MYGHVQPIGNGARTTRRRHNFPDRSNPGNRKEGIVRSYVGLLFALTAFCALWGSHAAALADTRHPPRSDPAAPRSCQSDRVQPKCKTELTCTDAYVGLPPNATVCFRATCPGIWALIHRRVDQESFNTRYLYYRHYRFRGLWELQDQGRIATGPTDLRELFLVLPDDLIEIGLLNPDCSAYVEVRNIGYIKKGDPCALRAWVERQSLMQDHADRKSGDRPCDPARQRRRDAPCRRLERLGWTIPLPGLFHRIGSSLIGW